MSRLTRSSASGPRTSGWIASTRSSKWTATSAGRVISGSSEPRWTIHRWSFADKQHSSWKNEKTGGSSCITTRRWFSKQQERNRQQPRRLRHESLQGDSRQLAPRIHRRRSSCGCHQTGLKVLQTLVNPHPGDHQEENPGCDSSGGDGLGEGEDLPDHFALLPGHVLFRLAQEELVIFPVRQNVAVDHQQDEHRRDNGPGDEKVKQWTSA